MFMQKCFLKTEEEYRTNYAKKKPQQQQKKTKHNKNQCHKLALKKIQWSKITVAQNAVETEYYSII